MCSAPSLITTRHTLSSLPLERNCRYLKQFSLPVFWTPIPHSLHLLQVLGFSAIVNFSFHRILRPANRLDPLRSILEVEIIGICWDALDGATLYQLLVTSSELSVAMSTAVRCLMFFWYMSVGCRLAIMYCSHLTPASRVYQVVLYAICLHTVYVRYNCNTKTQPFCDAFSLS